MRYYKKALTLAVAGALVATGMSGCGGKKKSNPVASKTETVIESAKETQYSSWKENTKVRAAIDSKDFATAISLATSRIDDNPGDARAHFLLGRALLEKGDLVKSKKSLEAAVKLDPDNRDFSDELHRCMMAMADSAIELDIPSEAIGLLKKLIQENYQPATVEKKLADVYEKTSRKLIDSGNLTEAETILREAMNMLPDQPEIKTGLAEMLINSDRLMEAERLVKSIQETSPDFVPGIVAQAKLLHRMGEPDKAGLILDQILSDNPGHAEAAALKASLSQDVPAVTVTRMPETDLNLEAWLEKLKLQEKTGNLSEQKVILTSISQNFTGETWALYKLSVVSEKLGQVDEALATIESFLKVEPASAKGQLHHARCLYQKGSHAEALAILDRLEATYPDKLELLSERGQVLARMGNFAQARVFWNQVLAETPDHTNTLFNFGQLEMESGNHDEAATFFEKAIRKEPFNNKFRYFAGLNLIQNGFRDRASALWEASKASLNPQDPYAARILKALGEEAAAAPAAVSLSAPPPTLGTPVESPATGHAETIIVPNSVITESPVDPDYERALEYARGGFYTEAIQSFKAVLAHNPANFNALMNLGKVYTATGRHQSAAVWYLKALKLDPRNIHALKALANSYSDVGMHNLAAQITEQVSASNPDQLEGFPRYSQKALRNDPRGIEPLATALLEEGLTSEALAVVQNGLAQQTDMPVLYLLQGDVLKKMGQHQQALEAYKTAMNHDTQSPAPFIRIGDLFLASGQGSAAAEEYQKALKTSFIDPDSMFLISDRYRQMGRESDAKTVLGRIKGMNLNNDQLKKLDERLGTSLAAPKKEENQ